MDTEPDIAMSEVRENSAGIREGFPTIGRREPHDNFRDPSKRVEDRATFLEGPLSQRDGNCTFGGQ